MKLDHSVVRMKVTSILGRLWWPWRQKWVNELVIEWVIQWGWEGGKEGGREGCRVGVSEWLSERGKEEKVSVIEWMCSNLLSFLLYLFQYQKSLIVYISFSNYRNIWFFFVTNNCCFFINHCFFIFNLPDIFFLFSNYF